MKNYYKMNKFLETIVLKDRIKYILKSVLKKVIN
jgi:hypothetical protein